MCVLECMQRGQLKILPTHSFHNHRGVCITSDNHSCNQQETWRPELRARAIIFMHYSLFSCITRCFHALLVVFTHYYLFSCTTCQFHAPLINFMHRSSSSATDHPLHQQLAISTNKTFPTPTNTFLDQPPTISPNHVNGASRIRK